jgi:hypothetical protein
MTEAATPHGEPYALAMALLAKHSGALPGAMVLFPDGIIWTPRCGTSSTRWCTVQYALTLLQAL